MVGQSESADIFVSELKAKEIMITGLSVLLSLFQWENKNEEGDQGYTGHFSLLKYSSHQFLLRFQVNVKFYAVTKWLAASQYSEKTK